MSPVSGGVHTWCSGFGIQNNVQTMLLAYRELIRVRGGAMVRGCWHKHWQMLTAPQYVNTAPGSTIPNIRCLTTNFHPFNPLAHKFLNFATQILLFQLKHTSCRHHTSTCATKFFNHFGSKCCLPKNNIFDQNWTDAGLRKHTKKLLPATYLCNGWS